MELQGAQVREKLEAVGEGFQLAKLLDAREKTWQAIAKIREAVRPGMTEDQAIAEAERIVKAMGSAKNWHPPRLRFGENTLLTFSERSAPEQRLQKNDIWFIDLGPIFDGYEGDCGDTFVVGDDRDYARCAADCRKVFELVREEWLRNRTSGIALYAFAEKAAESLGWRLNPKTDGHRVSEFPHQIHFKGGIGEVDFAPRPDAWILEIQIRHPEKPYGAFFEDLLRPDIS